MRLFCFLLLSLRRCSAATPHSTEPAGPSVDGRATIRHKDLAAHRSGKLSLSRLQCISAPLFPSSGSLWWRSTSGSTSERTAAVSYLGLGRSDSRLLLIGRPVTEGWAAREEADDVAKSISFDGFTRIPSPQRSAPSWQVWPAVQILPTGLCWCHPGRITHWWIPSSRSMRRRTVWIKTRLDYSGWHSRLISRIDIFPPFESLIIFFVLVGEGWCLQPDCCWIDSRLG